MLADYGLGGAPLKVSKRAREFPPNSGALYCPLVFSCQNAPDVSQASFSLSTQLHAQKNLAPVEPPGKKQHDAERHQRLKPAEWLVVFPAEALCDRSKQSEAGQ